MITIDNNPDVTATAEEITALLKRPDDFEFIDDTVLVPKLFVTWALGPIIETSNSTIVEQSNAAELAAMLAKRPEIVNDWRLLHLKHPTHGWVKRLAFKVLYHIPEIANLEANLKSATENAIKLDQDKADIIKIVTATNSCRQLETMLIEARFKYGEQPGFPGFRLAKAAQVVLAWQHVLKDVRVANEDVVNELEHRAALEAIRANGGSIVNLSLSHHVGWVEQVHDWLAEFNNAALSNTTGRGPEIGRGELIPAMWELGLLDLVTRAYIAELMLDALYCFVMWGMQSPLSMAGVLSDKLNRHVPVNDVRAAFMLLVGRDLVRKADGDIESLSRAAKRFPKAAAIADMAAATPNEVIYVRR